MDELRGELRVELEALADAMGQPWSGESLSNQWTEATRAVFGVRCVETLTIVGNISGGTTDAERTT